ncbi:S1 family peptidase [Streptomyces sp. 7N604]|uniref:S1 family peptidase n=1 Tax=Streptomyces sp. 7N604 TaxID=3457415 RepID=UPI003FD227BC
MKHRRISKRRTAVAAAGAAAVVATAFALSNANAATTPSVDTLTSTAAGKLASTLASDLGADTAGSYYDAGAKKLVVNVVNEAAAQQVRAKGAEAKLVRNTLAQLDSVKDTLTAKDVTGTARAVDVKTNKVVVTADSTVKGAELAELKKQIAAQDGKAVLKQSKGKFTTKIAGGDAIWGSGGRCSLGFNVTVNGQPAFLTAGHCTEAIPSWSDSEGGSEVATTTDGSFPDNDYGLATYTSEVDHPSEVNLYNGSAQAISKAGDATVGQQVQRSGSTTQLHDGEVLAVDASVTYPEGTVNGLIQTNVCAEPGDSGGSLFAGDTALGLTSGGSGDCSSGGETYFQPVPEALEVFGAQIG